VIGGASSQLANQANLHLMFILQPILLVGFAAPVIAQGQLCRKNLRSRGCTIEIAIAQEFPSKTVQVGSLSNAFHPGRQKRSKAFLFLRLLQRADCYSGHDRLRQEYNYELNPALLRCHGAVRIVS